MCLFAEYVDADEALRIGLVDRVVPRESLEAAAGELAERVLGFSATALRECKSLLARAGTLDADGYDRAFSGAQQRCLDARE
jgi:enoyl-CoA hydratase/carnithine racemase